MVKVPPVINRKPSGTLTSSVPAPAKDVDPRSDSDDSCASDSELQDANENNIIPAINKLSHRFILPPLFIDAYQFVCSAAQADSAGVLQHQKAVAAFNTPDKGITVFSRIYQIDAGLI